MIAYFHVEETVVHAPASPCYALVLAVRRYGEWWRGRCVPLGTEGVLQIGSRFRLSHGTIGGMLEVVRLEPHRRIELRYVDGDLLGPVGWEFHPRDDATRVCHAYRGVSANSRRGEDALAGDGLRRHGAALQADAFAGMRSLLEAPGADVSGGDLFTALHSQRAVRRFRPDPIPDSVLREILAAATRAPSARNTQPWVFVAVRDPARKAELGRHYLGAWHRAQAFTAQTDADADIKQRPDYPAMMRAVDALAATLDQAPVLVLCGLDTTRLGPMADANGHILAPQSAYASIFPAVQNLMLAARGLGVGSTLTTLSQLVEPEVRRAVALPEHVHIAALVPLGYPTRAFRATQRRPLEEVAFLDHWGNHLP